MPLSTEQIAYVRESFTPEKPPAGQSFDQYVTTETSSLAYAYQLDYGLPSLDEEATRTLVREICSEAGLATV